MHGTRLSTIFDDIRIVNFTIIFMYYNREGQPLNLQYSTSTTINKLFPSVLRIPLFQSAELDDNRDGRTDRIEIALQMPLAPSETIHGLSALVYLDAELNTKARYIIDSASIVTFESFAPISKISLDGDLLFRQTWPLLVKGG